MVNINIKYRKWFKGLPPKPIKLQVPGWAGTKEPEYGQPWQCKPFVDAATYGLELIYPYDTRVIVKNINGECQFHYDDKGEWKNTNIGFPFKVFAKDHFGFTSSLDIQTEKGYGVLILPHPRYFTDMTGNVPLPSIGMLEADWWSNIFFIAYRAPLEGKEYIFEKGSGIAQILIVPKKVSYNVQAMTQEEMYVRSKQESDISKLAPLISTKTWKDKDGNTFDNKYRVLSAVNDKGHSIPQYLRQIENCESAKTEERAKERADKLTTVFVRPNKK